MEREYKIMVPKMKKARRIDVHHHILPPELVSKLTEMGLKEGLGVPFPEWSPEKSLTFMKKNKITAAITSTGVPVVTDMEYTLLRELAGLCNEYTAELKEKYAGTFGGLATLPLPDVEGSLHELKYALDHLKLDGVGFFTHYKGTYLGSREFDKLFKELHRRGTVVFIHPIDPPENTGLTIPNALIEAPFETTRAVANLIYTGTTDRYPHIQYVLSHGGGTVPYLAWRIALIRYKQENKRAPVMRALYDFYLRGGPETGLKQLKSMYYDTALTSSPYALKALQEFVGPSRILFGTDYPFAAHLAPTVTKDLIAYDGFTDKDLTFIEYENALKLFPQLE